MKYIYNILKRFPYVLAIIAGLFFYLLASMTTGNLSGLILNVSASLITIPIVIFVYEAIKAKIAKESNKDLSDYVKVNIDREILALLNRVSPLVIGSPTPGLNKVLKLPKYTIIKGSEIDQVTKFENRYLLMAKTKKSNELAVAAFNDIKSGKYNIDLLTPMKPNNDGQELLLSCVVEILECVSAWTHSRGNDFLIDSRNFKMKRSRLKNRLS